MAEDANTVFLLQVKDDKTSNDFTDSSGKNHLIIDSGTVTSQTDDPKFGTYGGKVTASYSSPTEITVAGSDIISTEIGTGPFTVDAWLQLSEEMDGVDQKTLVVYVLGLHGIELKCTFSTVSDSLTIALMLDQTTNTNLQTATISPMPDAGEWLHIAAERDTDGQCYIYLDGDVQTQVDTSADSTSISFVPFFEVMKTTLSNYGTPPDDLDVYFDEIRVSDTARYGGESFTVPTARYDSTATPTWSPSGGGNDPSTIFLMQCEDALEDDDYSDSSGVGHTIDVASVCGYDSSNAKFGTYCCDFASAVIFDGSTYLDIGTDEFTFDLWVRRSPGQDYDDTLYAKLIDLKNSSGTVQVRLSINSYPTYEDVYEIYFTVGSDYTVIKVKFEDGEWYHIAAERQSDGRCVIYIDGLERAGDTCTSTHNISVGSSGTIELNSIYTGDCDYLAEEIRISNIARYNQNFAVPTSAYDSSPTGTAGEGVFTAPLFEISSSGVVGASGTGDFNAPLSEIEAEGSLSPAGIGSFTQENAIIEASGTVAIVGTGSFTAPKAKVYGFTLGGTGSFTAPKATISATGTVPVIGTGNFVSKSPSIVASGYSAIVGTGSFTAPKSTISGNTSNGGWGQFNAPVSQVYATGHVYEIISGDAEFNAPLFDVNGEGVVGELTDSLLEFNRLECTFSGGDLEEATLTETILSYSR